MFSNVTRQQTSAVHCTGKNQPLQKLVCLLFFSSVVIELPEWMGLQGLRWLFTAVQLHLHWGNDGPGHGGSEHTINGRSADAEVRLNTSVKPSKSNHDYTKTRNQNWPKHIWQPRHDSGGTLCAIF